MTRRSILAFTAALAALPAAAAHAAPGDLTRVSLAQGDAQASAAITGPTAVSADGRYVAFLSQENLSGVATGGKLQVFVRDRKSGTTVLASSSEAGVPANADVAAGTAHDAFIDISVRGEYVVFGTIANNLVAGDTNGKADVFRKDLRSGDVQLLSSETPVFPAAAGPANGDSSDPSISGDGQRVAFVTEATNMLLSRRSTANSVSTVYDRNTTPDIALWTPASTSWVSVNTDNTPANGPATAPSISADGDSVAFEVSPTTTNLYFPDTNGLADVIVKALPIGMTPAKITPVPGASAPDLSGNGRYVAFETSAALDAAADTNSATDIYRRDVVSNATTLVSARNGLAGSGNAAASGPSISADGTRVAFNSDATNLDVGDGNAARDVFVRTLDNQSTVRASRAADGSEQSAASDRAAISGNGGVVAFSSEGAFATADTNAVADIYANEFSPTDTTGPSFGPTSCNEGYKDTSSSVAARILADPSGLLGGSLVTAGFGYAVVAAAPGQSVQFGAVDGAGNSTTLITPPTLCLPPTPKPVKLRISSVTLTQRNRARINFTTSVTGITKVWIERLSVKRGQRPAFVRATKTRTFTKLLSTPSVTIPRPTAHGIYRVVMVAPPLSAQSTPQVTTRQFRV